jgi:hypothetical protein
MARKLIKINPKTHIATKFPKDKPLVFWLRFEVFSKGAVKGFGTYGHVRVGMLQEIKPLEEYRGFYGGSMDAMLDHFEINCQFDPDSILRESDNRVYGWDYEIRNTNIDLGCAWSAHCLLDFINVGLDKLREEWGYPSSFGQFVNRVGKVLGINRVIINSKDDVVMQRDFDGIPHRDYCSGYDYRDFTLSGGADHIDYTLQAFRASILRYRESIGQPVEVPA